MSSIFISALVLLISIVFDLYLMVLGVRLVLAFERANYFNPITRFVISVTQPFVAPIRNIISNAGRIEMATVFFIVLLEMIKIQLITSLEHLGLPFSYLFLIALLSACSLILTVLFYAVIISVVMSWFQKTHTPLAEVVTKLAAPILRPFRLLFNSVGGYDISPVFALITLQVLNFILIGLKGYLMLGVK